MRTYFECYPCLLNRAIQAAKRNQLSESEQKKILNSVMEYLQDVPPDTSPPQISHHIHRLVRESTGIEDPYEQIKLDYDVRGLNLMPVIRQKINQADDPFEAAVRYAIAGTVLDVGEDVEGDSLERELESAPDAEFGINHLSDLKRDLSIADRVLYLAENAGEIAFDRLLVEAIQQRFRVEITFVVRDQPVLNSATLEDARYVGLEPLVHLITNESDAPTTILDSVKGHTKKYLETSDVILSKGQWHYEALSESDLNIYYMFKARCGVITTDMKTKLNSYILASGRKVGTKSS